MGVKTTAAITTVKRDIQLREWTEQIKAQQESGMTVTAFCAQNGINPKTYYYHLRKVREQCLVSEPAIVPVAVLVSREMVCKYHFRQISQQILCLR